MLQVGRSQVRVPDEVDFFNLPHPSSRTMALVSRQGLTEMSTRNLPGGKKRPVRRLTTLPPSVRQMSENVGATTSRNPKGLHGLYSDNLTLIELRSLKISKMFYVTILSLAEIFKYATLYCKRFLVLLNYHHCVPCYTVHMFIIFATVP
jgi:hypothetical protein